MGNPSRYNEIEVVSSDKDPGYDGSYNSSTDRLTMFTEAMKKEYGDNFESKFERVFLHEGLHAITSIEISVIEAENELKLHESGQIKLTEKEVKRNEDKITKHKHLLTPKKRRIIKSLDATRKKVIASLNKEEKSRISISRKEKKAIIK